MPVFERLAKAVAEASSDAVHQERRRLLAELDQPRSHQQEGKKPVKLAKLQKKLAKAQAELAKVGTSAPPTAQMSLGTAFAKMSAAAKAAETEGDVAKARDIRREVCLLKMSADEQAYQERGRQSEFGPGVRKIFRKVGNLPDDPSVGGL